MPVFFGGNLEMVHFPLTYLHCTKNEDLFSKYEQMGSFLWIC